MSTYACACGCGTIPEPVHADNACGCGCECCAPLPIERKEETAGRRPVQERTEQEVEQLGVS